MQAVVIVIQTITVWKIRHIKITFTLFKTIFTETLKRSWQKNNFNKLNFYYYLV
jgi:hypothetical protein